MSELMDRILAGKERERQRLANLPFDQKIEILEKLRDHAVAMRKWREEQGAAAKRRWEQEHGPLPQRLH